MKSEEVERLEKHSWRENEVVQACWGSGKRQWPLMPFLSGCRETMGIYCRRGRMGWGEILQGWGTFFLLVLKKKPYRQPKDTTLTCYGSDIQKRILVS